MEEELDNSAWRTRFKEYFDASCKQPSAALLLITLPLALLVPPIALMSACVPTTPGSVPSSLMAALLFFTFVVVMSLAEEFVFRGVVLELLASRLKFAYANALQAVLFGLLHLILDSVGVLHLFAITLLGILLGIVKRGSGTIAAAFAVHVSYNLILLVSFSFVAKFLPVDCGEHLPTVYVVIGASSIGALANLLIVVLLASRRGGEKHSTRRTTLQ
jgi:membrane protease YdiL (CAAX protease family)